MNGNGGRSEGRPRGGGKNRGNGGHPSAREGGGEYRNGSQNGGRNDRKEHNGRKDRSGRNDYSESKRGEGEHNKKFPGSNRRQGRAYQKPLAGYRDKRVPGFNDRPKWMPVKKPDEPIPEIVCSLCGKPITDLASAISDREGDGVFHFDCIAAKLKERETLGAGDSLTYIGGGRFGVVHRDSPKKFTIKKIIEWDQREDRVPWRKLVADYYSNT